ncbi:MAG: hypothetical protein SGILL_006996, partial [Bacillariaceae sp.]
MLFRAALPLLLLAHGASAAGLCRMQYSMADNNLHSFLVRDINEMVDSQLIREPDVTTWIYVDGHPDGDLDDRIKGMTYADGSISDILYMDRGVRYLSCDSDMGHLVVRNELPELNSDLPQQLFDFMVQALADCVDEGRTEFMLSLSSHGSGYGFGGDETLERTRRLEQANENIVTAVLSALEKVEGAPDRLDLLGFDACLQASMESLKAYQPATKYYVASEATVPGSGWAYDKWTQTSAFLLGLEVVDTFVETPTYYDEDGEGVHQGPKTLGMFDLDMIDPFYEAWENLSAEMMSILDARNDLRFVSTLARTRARTASFKGTADQATDGPVDVPATMDVGDFMSELMDRCNPNEDTSLFALLEEAKQTYSDMFNHFEKGPITRQAATGVATVWPSKLMYEGGKADEITNEVWYDFQLFSEEGEKYQPETPVFNEFVFKFLNYDAEGVAGDSSICSCPQVDRPDGMLLWDTLVQDADDIVTIEGQIADVVDAVLIEYGVDVTSLVMTDDDVNVEPTSGSGRKLAEGFSRWKSAVQGRGSAGVASNTARRLVDRNGEVRSSTVPNRRRTQEGQFDEDDYFLIFGGSVLPDYQCNDMGSFWDKSWYFLLDIETGEPVDFLYSYRNSGNDLSTVPVLYFGPDTAADVKTEIQ